jgi:hypothetical protein
VNNFPQLSQRQKEEYFEICETIWGCVPIDVIWAKETKKYKEAEKEYFQKNKKQ